MPPQHPFRTNVAGRYFVRCIHAHAMIEFRVACRSVRYWLPATLAIAATVLLFAYSADLSHRGAVYLPTAALFAPGTFLSLHGLTILGFFLVALVFPALDVDRDEREGVADVLGARPWTNLPCLAGRCLALATMGWLPLLAAVALIQTLGYVAGRVHWLGGTLDLVPLVTFVFIEALPTLLLWSAVLVWLPTWLRSRLAVGLVALSLLVAWLYALSHIPAYLLPVLSPVSWHGEFTSEELPATPSLGLLLVRTAVVAVALGVVAVAAALCRREDDRRPKNAIIGTCLASAGLGVIVAVGTIADSEVDLRSRWLAAHRTASIGYAPAVDLEHVAGFVRVSPGRDLHVDVQMRLRRVAAVPVSSLVLGLNPTMEIAELRLGESEAEYSHEWGLLHVVVPPHLREAAVLTLSLRANGVPDSAFAYLDSAVDWRREPGGGPLAFLGREASLFDARYVALMPAVRWLPAVGPTTDRNDGYRDLFTVDLTVETPPDWLAAGPGRRTSLGPGRFRFNPAAPVADVAVFAADFERLAVNAGGVELELLVLGNHVDDIAGFADAVPLLVDWFEGLMLEAQVAGLPYPYEGLSLVDVPTRLRTYGGGWRMDTVQSLPGILMVREANFKTWRYRRAMLRSSEPRTKLRLVKNYWRNNATGGDPVFGLVRNVLSFQTSARGDGALASNFLVEELAGRLFSLETGDFSAFDFVDAAQLPALAEKIHVTALAFDLTAGLADTASSEPLPAVWDRALAAPLADLDPGLDPRRALGVLRLKCRRLADLVIDVLGRRATAEILADLRRRHSESGFDFDDLIAAVNAINADLASDLVHWLLGTALPGFHISQAEVFRLRGDLPARPGYQILFHVRNDESVPGWVRFRFGWGKGSFAVMYDGEPVRIGGLSSVEVALVSGVKPNQLFAEPYLALNRRALYVDLDDGLERFPPPPAPIWGSTSSSWRPVPTEGLIVDDLDPGFAIRRDAGTDYGHPFDGPRRIADGDQGLPAYRPPKLLRRGATWRDVLPFLALGIARVANLVGGSVDDPVGKGANVWYRQESPSAWGRYRRTLARSPAGDGGAKAVFSCDLPVSGRWRLDYHLPDLAIAEPVGRSRADVVVGTTPVQQTYEHGSLHLRLVAADREVEVDLDGFIGPAGWRSVGEFAMERGGVDVVVSNQSTGPFVFADAIRWRRVDG